VPTPATPDVVRLVNGVPLPTAPVKVAVPPVFTARVSAPSTVELNVIALAPVSLKVVPPVVNVTGPA